MDEKAKGILIGGCGGSFLILIGVVAILNIDPYRDNCGWLDFYCTPELKTPFELVLEHIWPVILIIIGSIAILVLILLEILSDKHKSAQTRLSAKEKEKIRERVGKLKSGNFREQVGSELGEEDK